MQKRNSAHKEKLAIDSNRHSDANGYLHIAVSPLTKEAVNPYWGREIPNWEQLGLDPEKIYQGYRAGAELQKAVKTFNGIPLLIEHKLDSADDPLKDERIGSVGTNAEWKPPYIMNALTVTDARAINLIKSGAQKELSACYRYIPVFENGTFNGIAYDFIMTDIEANHVAVVDEGRAGADVYVYDSKLKNTLKEKSMSKLEELRKALDGVVSAVNGFLDEEAKEPEHAKDEEQNKKTKEAMDAAGCDAENPAEQKAFGEGVKYGEKKEKEEPKKLDAEHESEGMKKAMDAAGCDAENSAEQKAFGEGVKYGEKKEKEEPKKLTAEHESEGEKKATEEAAKDKQLAMDKAMQQAEARGAERAMSKMRSLYEAADAVRHTISIKAVAYDSAEDIYAKALHTEGVSTAGVEKSAYKSLYLAVLRNKVPQAERGYAKDSTPAEETAFSKNVSIEQ